MHASLRPILHLYTHLYVALSLCFAFQLRRTSTRCLLRARPSLISSSSASVSPSHGETSSQRVKDVEITFRSSFEHSWSSLVARTSLKASSRLGIPAILKNPEGPFIDAQALAGNKSSKQCVLRSNAHDYCCVGHANAR